MDPPVSVPRAKTAKPAAMAAPLPPLDPDGVRSRAQGFRICPPSVEIAGPRRELAHVGLAQDHASGGTQPSGLLGVLRRHRVTQRIEAGGCRQAKCVNVVLEQHRNAV